MIGFNLQANGIRQHILRFEGNGPPLIVIPGITSPAISWDFIADPLSDWFDVYVLDVRGRGLSQGGDLDYSLDVLAADVIEVVMALGLSRPRVLGHSMGARVAIRASVQAPNAIGDLILVDPPVSGPGRRPYPSPWSWYEDSIRLAERGCSAEEMKDYCPSWSDSQLACRAEWLHTCDLEAIRTAYDGFHTDDIHKDLPDITASMCLMVAADAPVIETTDIEEILSLNPTINVKVVEKAGHMIPWDNLEGFLSAVESCQFHLVQNKE